MNVVDDFGKFLLIYVVENGFIVIVKELFDYGVYVNYWDWNKRMFLRIVMESGKKYLVSFFLKNRVLVYILDEDMKVLFYYVVEKNFFDIVELLLDYGVLVN